MFLMFINNNINDTRLKAIFQDNLGKPVPECHRSGFYWSKNDGDGGDNWSCKKCKIPVKSLPPTNQHPALYRPDVIPVIQPTVS